MNLKFAVVAVALVGFAGSASAATTLTFNLAGNKADATSYTFTEDGINLTVKPAEITNFSTPSVVLGDKVTQTSSGVGVKNGSGDSGQIDGSGSDDALAIYFSKDVTLLTMVLVGGSKGESFYYLEDTDDNGLLSGDLIGGPFGVGTSPYTIDFTTMTLAGADFYGDVFGIATACKNCGWRVKEITVSYGDPSTVPLPAALPLLATGLAGLAVLRRRRRLNSAEA